MTFTTERDLWSLWSHHRSCTQESHTHQVRGLLPEMCVISNPFSQFLSFTFQFFPDTLPAPLCPPHTSSPSPHSLFSLLCLIGVADPNLAPAFDLKTQLIDVEENASKSGIFQSGCKNNTVTKHKNLLNKASALSESFWLWSLWIMYVYWLITWINTDHLK